MKPVLVAVVVGVSDPPIEEFPPPTDADVQMTLTSEAAPPEELPIREAEVSHETPWYVARYDYGGEGLHRYGLGYHPWGAWKSDQGPAVAWWSLGPEVLFTTRRHRHMESAELAFRGRAGMFGHAGLGISLEAAVSVATDFALVVPTGTVGFLANVAVIEVGIMGQVPITKRPDWMPAPWLAVRLHIPESWPH